jgi:RimJ/RimL family protein N-acetyltransferase
VSAPPEVSLRRFAPEDAGAVHRWFNNRAATKTLVEQRQSFSLAEAEQWVARAMDDAGEDRKYAIVVAGHDEPVGFTALYGLSREGGPELGALIGDEVRRSGVGRRAEALTIAKAFDEFGADRVYGEIPAFNEAAKRTVAGLGWRHERTMTGGGEREGEPFDLEIWAVLPEDFRAATAGLVVRGAERTPKSDRS